MWCILTSCRHIRSNPEFSSLVKEDANLEAEVVSLTSTNQLYELQHFSKGRQDDREVVFYH